MRIISNRALLQFSTQHPRAHIPLQGWKRVVEKNSFPDWAALKASFRTVDKVGDLAVFDIGGNKYRLIAYIRFEKQLLYVKGVMTHEEYDTGAWKKS